MVESIGESEARKGRLSGGRIKALKGEPMGGFGLKHGQALRFPIFQGAKRVRDPAGAGGRKWTFRHRSFGGAKTGK
jgi:hypothetical protein